MLFWFFKLCPLQLCAAPVTLMLAVQYGEHSSTKVFSRGTSLEKEYLVGSVKVKYVISLYYIRRMLR